MMGLGDKQIPRISLELQAKEKACLKKVGPLRKDQNPQCPLTSTHAYLYTHKYAHACVSVLPACMYVYHVHTVPMIARRGHCFP